MELDFKLFIFVDSGSAYIVFEQSYRCHFGIIEYFYISKMASQIEANYKRKDSVIWKNVSNSLSFLNC